MIQKQICFQVQVLLNNFKNSVRYIALFHYTLSKRMAKAARYTNNMLNGHGFDTKSVSENIAEVFFRCKPEFLRYAPLIHQSNNLKRYITSITKWIIPTSDLMQSLICRNNFMNIRPLILRFYCLYIICFAGMLNLTYSRY